MADEYPITMYIEGIERKTTEEDKHVEFRMDACGTEELSKGYYQIDININMLWSVDIDHVDFYESQRIIGKILEYMTNICVYEYADGEAYVGELVIQETQTANFGQIKEDAQVLQGTVDGRYVMHLTT